MVEVDGDWDPDCILASFITAIRLSFSRTGCVVGREGGRGGCVFECWLTAFTMSVKFPFDTVLEDF